MSYIELIVGAYGSGKSSYIKSELIDKQIIRVTKSNISSIINQIVFNKSIPFKNIHIDNISIIGKKLNILLYLIKYKLCKSISKLYNIYISGNNKIVNSLVTYFAGGTSTIKLITVKSKTEVKIIDHIFTEDINADINSSIADTIDDHYSPNENILIFLSSYRAFNKLKDYLPEKFTDKLCHISDIKNDKLDSTEGMIIVSVNELKKRYIPNIRLVIDECRIYNTIYNPINHTHTEIHLPISKSKSDNRKGILQHSKLSGKLVYCALCSQKVYNKLLSYNVASIIKNSQDIASTILVLMNNKYFIDQIYRKGVMDTFIPFSMENLLAAKEKLIDCAFITSDFKFRDIDASLLSRLGIYIDDIRYLAMLKTQPDYNFVTLWLMAITRFSFYFPNYTKLDIYDIVTGLESELSKSQVRNICEFFMELIDICYEINIPISDPYSSYKDLLTNYNTVFIIKPTIYLKDVKGLRSKVTSSLLIDDGSNCNVFCFLKNVFKTSKKQKYKEYPGFYLSISTDKSKLLLKNY